MLEIEEKEKEIIDMAKKVATQYTFGNRRIKDFFSDKIKETGKQLSELKSEYYEVIGFDLGKIELIL